MSKTPHVAIIGCGPSGMLAAHAVRSVGLQPIIFAKEPRPSRLSGAMYLHESIPGLTKEMPDGTITIVKRGTAEGYALKVYGDARHPVSWHHFEEGESPMWSLRDAYERACEKYKYNVIKCDVSRATLFLIQQRYQHVICTAPKPQFCVRPDEHFFTAQPIWIRVSSRANNPAKTTMVYSGLPDEPWYRASHIDGFTSHEYAFKPPRANPLEGRKPINNNCNCWPHITWVGRFGAWKKGVLTHHVFQQVHDAVYQLF